MRPHASVKRPRDRLESAKLGVNTPSGDGTCGTGGQRRVVLPSLPGWEEGVVALPLGERAEGWQVSAFVRPGLKSS